MEYRLTNEDRSGERYSYSDAKLQLEFLEQIIWETSGRTLTYGERQGLWVYMVQPVAYDLPMVKRPEGGAQ